MKKYIFLILFFIIGLLSCQKEYLEKKPNKALLIPETLTDFQNLLDNLNVFNIQPGLQVIASDDFSTTDVKLNTFSIPEKNSYLWTSAIDQGQQIADWNIPYQQVFYANVVLDGLKKISVNANNQILWNSTKGSALFHRAYAFYNVAQMYAKPFNSITADLDLGIPIRLVSDVNLKSDRGTLKNTYKQIIADLLEADHLLPVISSFQSRPNRVAAKALLARVYLNMNDYKNALDFASQSLQLNNTLIDYNKLNIAASSPFSASPNTNNPEILFYSKLNSYTFSISTSTTVNDELYQLYTENDLRKEIFYKAGIVPYFKGRYTGSSLRLFGGLANDEIYLIKAECEARLNDIDTAMAVLNKLLKTRWKNTATYTNLTATNSDEALKQILNERRKELAFRGLRWGDLRRLNQEASYATSITRIFNNQNYILVPNSKNYTFPIPTQEILISGFEQNQ